MRSWIFIAALAGLATLGLLSWLRSFPLELGLMSAVGTAALVFATLQTVQRLRDQAEKEREARRALGLDESGSADD
ncbi:MAG: hypothetical protein AAGA81_14015 [Acidobacteriota bacterium]